MTSTATSNQAKMLDRVRKLFAQAESVAGTPEAIAFEAKALELITEYGISETEARERRGDGPAPIETVKIRLSGAYEKEQALLLQTLAETLHCSTIWLQNGHTTVLYGAAIHTDRVTMLFNLLLLHMRHGVARVRNNGRHSLVVSRRSFIRGFIVSIQDRLREAESTATESAAPGTGLVLVSDAERAEARMRADNPNMRFGRSRNVQHDESAGRFGSRTGSRIDLGGTAIGGGRALSR